MIMESKGEPAKEGYRNFTRYGGPHQMCWLTLSSLDMIRGTKRGVDIESQILIGCTQLQA